ncbi:MAG: methyltransferase type 11 [candidate division NC10 bacterium RBG_16_65_8]|nr:MAG: methyltransferase type 11 [candidate division NC10 bacterium RBG_16_65_8]
MPPEYVHGYSSTEGARLTDQASTLTELLHSDTSYPPGSLVLEAGCGVGAQTVVLARRSPGARIVSVEISPESLIAAQERVRAAGLANVAFREADIYTLPFPAEHFDHVFVCFVLEHLARVAESLRCLTRVLRQGGTLTVIEGDHGSAYFHPDSEYARRTVQCLVELQRRAGGDALIGRRLHPLLTQAGLRDVRVSPRMVYVDASRPALVDGFIRKTFTAMVEGVGEQAIRQGLTDPETWHAGIRDLHRTAESDGTFCYTFFKAVGVK